MKAESLPDASSSNIFDPRPTAYQGGEDKNAKLYSLMVNYVYDSNHDINLRYMYPRANLQAAVDDHDYLDRPYTEYWIKNNVMVCVSSSYR